jgi:hypothetical protein
LLREREEDFEDGLLRKWDFKEYLEVEACSTIIGKY